MLRTVRKLESGGARKKTTIVQRSVGNFNGFVVTHFSGSGFNNQVHQILNGMAIAKALNRTYCLSPFLRRKSDETNAETKFTNFMEIFDVSSFTNVLNLEVMDRCSAFCGGSIDFIVNMSPRSISKQAYDRQFAMQHNGFQTNLKNIINSHRLEDLGTSWIEWENEVHVRSALRFKDAKCIELYQPFPASKLITDGYFNFLPSSLKFSSSIITAATEIGKELFFDDAYVSVHWRYEYQKKGESKCRKKSLQTRGSGDICFVIFLKSFRRSAKDYLNFGDCGDCEKYLQYVHIEDIGKVLRDYQVLTRKKIFLASDADARIIDSVRKFVDFKMISDSKIGRKVVESKNMELISVIEQALCVQGEKFMGTSYSTWTTTVWMLRSPRFEEEEERIHGYIDILSANIS